MANRLQAQAMDFLGKGLVTPFRRTGSRDFASSSGVQLIRSSLRQIVGTRKGELRWRPGFGTRLEREKHKLNNDERAAMITNELLGAIAQFEPRVSQANIEIRQKDNLTTARVTWKIIDKNVAGNQVLLGPDSFETRI